MRFAMYVYMDMTFFDTIRHGFSSLHAAESVFVIWVIVVIKFSVYNVIRCSKCHYYEGQYTFEHEIFLSKNK